MKRAIGILLAGVLCAAMCIGLAGCKGQKAFYTLEEAYEAELLTYEDLQQIYYLRNDEEAPRLTLTAEEDAAIRQSFFDNSQEIKEQLGLGGAYSSPDEIKIDWYGGCYRGNYVVYIVVFVSAPQAVLSDKIEDLTFYHAYGVYIFVWTNPEEIEF